MHPSVENGNVAIEALVHFDDRLGIASLPGIGQKLDLFGAEGDRVVVAHGAPVLEAEDSLRIEAGGPRAIGGGRMRRRLGEAGVVVREEVLQEGIRPLTVGDMGEAQFCPQPILEGTEEPLDAPLGLWTVSGDPLDA